MVPFDNEGDAIRFANDMPYGLAAYAQFGDPEHPRRVARRLHVGVVKLSGASPTDGSPFGGYKQSGNGREGGRWRLADFLEVKAIAG